MRALLLPPADAHVATGILLLTWTIFTAYMTVAALRTNAAQIAIFGTVLHIGGFVGLAAAACAWYGSAAGVVNPTWGRTVLPVHPIAH